LLVIHHIRSIMQLWKKMWYDKNPIFGFFYYSFLPPNNPALEKNMG